MPYQSAPSKLGTLTLEHCDNRNHPDNGQQVIVGLYADDEGGDDSATHDPGSVPTVQIDAPVGVGIRIYVNGAHFDVVAGAQ